ncbi:hypothetical protein URH17368_0959 [Alicyclobacillus hesperidum URH17-3-68]|nr:hypothetical protein URH17368_0959 [Alicyclobacillus hesperidum URH17-3-68]
MFDWVLKRSNFISGAYFIYHFGVYTFNEASKIKNNRFTINENV